MYETGRPPSEVGEDDEYANDTEGAGGDAGSRMPGGDQEYDPDAYAFETYEEYNPDRSGTWFYEGEPQVRQEPGPAHYSPYDDGDGIYSDDGRSDTIGGGGGGGVGGGRYSNLSSSLYKTVLL